MPIYEFGQNDILPVKETTFSQGGLQERRDLQRLLREHIKVIAPDTLIIAEEFEDWEDSRRRIDLLGVDEAANLVVIELKRTEDGGHMDLQSIRYASMVSTTTFDQAVDIFSQYLTKLGRVDEDPRAIILKFLGWDVPDDDKFAPDVRIVLASAEFSRELTSSVLWLNDHGTDIRCVRLKPYILDGRILVDVQQIIPLPEAADYQIRVREKIRKERQARVRFSDDMKITLLKKPEERAAIGTAKYQQFLLYKEGMTVGEFLAKGGKHSWLNRDVKYGHVSVK
jgi:hypothetical protein